MIPKGGPLSKPPSLVIKCDKDEVINMAWARYGMKKKKIWVPTGIETFTAEHLVGALSFELWELMEIETV